VISARNLPVLIAAPQAALADACALKAPTAELKPFLRTHGAQWAEFII
jgi:hypothetical protein